MRIGRVVGLTIINTGMPIPVFKRPVAELLVMGKLISPLCTDQFLPGDRDLANKVSVYPFDCFDCFDSWLINIKHFRRHR